jgi:hypothetical protein
VAADSGTPARLQSKKQMCQPLRRVNDIRTLCLDQVSFLGSLLSSVSSPDHTNVRGRDDGADDFPHYAQYAQGEIARSEVSY